MLKTMLIRTGSGLAAAAILSTSLAGVAAASSDNNWCGNNNRCRPHQSRDFRDFRSFRSDVRNTNNILVTNNNTQNARTGDVSAEDNFLVGSLRSGDAINTNRTDTNINIRNGF